VPTSIRKSLEHPRLTLVSLFAGIGGIDQGFRDAGFEVVAANEFDENAAKSYRANQPDSEAKESLLVEDITNARKVSGSKILASSKLEKGELSVLAGGFPCQPFSIAGHKRGFEDDRGNVFWDIIRLARDLQPKVIFLENVRNLKSHDSGNTFETIKAALEGKRSKPGSPSIKLSGKNTYRVETRILNSVNFGVPQNRERIYIIAIRKDILGNVHLPSENQKIVPEIEPLENYIDFDSKNIDQKYFIDRYPFHEIAKKSITEVGSIYQWRRHYVRKNQSGVCPTLTANMGMGGHNVPLILTRANRIRKLTPDECLKLMGFRNFIRPEAMPDHAVYKQAGNSVVVPVIRHLAETIKKILED